MTELLFIDFETYSAVDIKVAGGMAYASDDSTQIICLAWAFNQEEPTLWTVASGRLPERVIKHVTEGGKVCAFNATFDWRIWNKVGVRDFNWPAIPLLQVADAQALCACYQLPQNLADAGAALEIPMPKDAAGKAYVKACCIPNKHGEQPFPTSTNTTSFQGLFRYCLRDVVAMQQIVYKLPRQELIPQEQEIWEFTVEMNCIGLPVDIDSVISIYEYLQKYIEKTVVELPILTNGIVTTPGQIARIIKWCASKGFIIPNLQAETVELAIAKTNTPKDVRRILELRQELGRSSTAKYKKIAEQAVIWSGQAWVHDNLRYHGAGTGRLAGQGFQMHNLPRLSIEKICKERKLQRANIAGESIIEPIEDYEDPETWINMFKVNMVIDDPVQVAKALIRPMICAPPGYTIAVADYSSIENRILAWAADDCQTMEDFNNGLDQYVTMAAARFGVPYDKVTSEQRRVGKVIILGCIAEHTKVLTDRGPVPIQNIQLTDKLWDGEKWVSHDGVLNKGQRECDAFCGTWLTPDHEIYFGDTKEEVWRHAGSTQSEVQAICLAFGKFLTINHEQILQNATQVMTSYVHSAETYIFKFWQTLKKATVLNAESAGEKLFTNLIWKHIVKLQDLTKQLLNALSIDGSLQNPDVMTRIILRFIAMAPEESRCVMNGQTLEHLLYMLLPYQDLTTQTLSSTESTMIRIMNPATSGFVRARKICLTHDILNAGNLNRFTLLTSKGPIVVSNCGYGMGGKKFKTTAALQAGLDLSDEEAKASVDAYRDRYPLVKALWAHLRNAAAETVISGSKRRYKNTTFGVFSRNGIKWLALQLPTGKSLYYMNPTIKDEFIPDYEYMGAVATITHSGINPYTKKWSRLKLIPGRITENLVQGTAREVMMRGMLNVKKHMPHVKIIGSVHDEALALIKTEDATPDAMAKFTHHLCDVDFLPDCPIKAVGFFTKRYKKG